MIEANIDGRTVSVPKGTTIFDAARGIGIAIPTVCHLPPQEPAGVCRVCVVDVGAKTLAPACARLLEPGMKVTTVADRITMARRTLIELLMADHQAPCPRQWETEDCELEVHAKQLGARPDRYAAARTEPLPFAGWHPFDNSHPNIAVDHAACILCDRCVRACTDVVHNTVIGRAGKGNSTVITFDDGRLMGDSSCVSCGECLVSCPTGALMNKGFGEAGLEGVPVFAEELLAIPGPDGGAPLFDGISLKFLKKTLDDTRNDGAVVKRTFGPNEKICTEGDFGSTAFYIVSGTVKVSITAPQSYVRTERKGRSGFMTKMRSLLVSADDQAGGTTIPIDASTDLDRTRPVATRRAGELFGEMTCLSFYPRSATVTTVEETVVIEILRPLLQILLRSKRFRAHLEQVYRERALDAHLRSIPLFADVPQEFVDFLRPRISLQRYEPGEVIYRQGADPDGFYLVRIGFVKVTQHLPGGDFVRAYRGRGEFFGEMAMLLDIPRTATCSAADHVEVVRIGVDDFRLVIERFPEIGRRLQEEAERRRATYVNDPLLQTGSVHIEDMLRQGLMEAQSLLLLDLDRCTRCDLCVQACATAHDGVTRLVREGLRYDNYLVATSCRQCRDPVCMVGCPVGSIRRRENLEIKIESWCIGCAVCAENCPYGNINMHPFSVEEDDPERPGRTQAVVRQKATACDLCKNLGDHQEPSCVVACPHGAAIRVDNPTEFFAGRLSTL